ncbi:Heme oxygenase [Marinomonas spartinae]|uniref:Heme oxygenase n=1 Tax=Marinomonas spartinae TaxID=1792290 RepID=A0A1A8T4B7_9GAMM|nr:biliverdin-producing heme oxygenase [Marinomonas spartinae]SBS25976.1 Heme oxygenase [Marinomonas spartinae]
MAVTLGTKDRRSLAKFLKLSTRGDHDGVDQMVMSSKPFASQENYAKFLTLQYLFHLSVAPLYHHEPLQAILPGLSTLSRLDAVEADLADLGLVPQIDADMVAKVDDVYEAIGWLYCSEGSNIGAAFLYKETQKLYFDKDHGARHLASPIEGRALHWRQFVAQLDALELTDEQSHRVLKGAVDAFDFYKTTLRRIF